MSSIEAADPVRETQVAWRVRRYLIEAGYTVRGEVPFLSKRIDLVGVRPDTGRVVAIEAKIRNWRRGIQQALPYKLCSHESYLALSAGRAKSVDKHVLKEFGIGLISVDGHARLEMSARSSSVVHPAFLKAVRDRVLLRG